MPHFDPSHFDPSHGGRLIKREDGHWVLREDLHTEDGVGHLIDALSAASFHLKSPSPGVFAPRTDPDWWLKSMDSRHPDLDPYHGQPTPRLLKPLEKTRVAEARRERLRRAALVDPAVIDRARVRFEEALTLMHLHAAARDAQKDPQEEQRRAADARWERQAVDPSGKTVSQLQGKTVWLWHGTTDAFKPQIERDGLSHRAPHWSNVGRTAASRATPGYVYLTADRDQANTYARAAAGKHGGNPMLLRTAVPFDELEPDKDDADTHTGRSQWRLDRGVAPDEIKEINGQRRESHKGLHGAPTILESAPAHNRAEHPFVATIRFAGLPLINVECKKGSQRSGVDPDGNPWSVTMPAHYGEFDGTLGVDGDPIDVYVGGNRHAPYAYLVPVARLDDGGYDEDKVFVGFNNLDEVCAAFRAAYNKRGFRFDVTRRMTIPALAEWLRDHGQKGKRIRLGVELHKGFAWAREALKALQTTMFGVSPNLQTVTKTDKNGRTERRHVKAGVDPRQADPRTIDLEDAIRAKQEAARPKPPAPPHPDPMIRQIQTEESERGKPKPAPEPETYSGPDTSTIGLPGIADPNQPSIGGRLPTPAKKFADMIDMLTTRQKAETAARRASSPRTFSVHRHLGGSAA